MNKSTIEKNIDNIMWHIRTNRDVVDPKQLLDEIYTALESIRN